MNFYTVAPQLTYSAEYSSDSDDLKEIKQETFEYDNN